jgi:hypothetical protein
MDARIDPAAAYGIELGDAHIIRNAGGNTQDAIRSLVISEQLLATKEILVIKHTGKFNLIAPSSIWDGTDVIPRLWHADIRQPCRTRCHQEELGRSCSPRMGRYRFSDISRVSNLRFLLVRRHTYETCSTGSIKQSAMMLNSFASRN